MLVSVHIVGPGKQSHMELGSMNNRVGRYGYQVYNALNTPIYAKAFLARFYADSIAGSITSQDIIPAELKQCGDQVTFRVAPVGEIFDYINNQDLEVSTLNTELKTMVVKRGKYWNLKLSYVDEKRTCNIKEYVNEFMENSTLLLRQHIDREILTEVPLLADPLQQRYQSWYQIRCIQLRSIRSACCLKQRNNFN